MDHRDFQLSDAQLSALRDAVGKASRRVHENEGEPASDVTVRFLFSPVGREVEVSVSGGPWITIDEKDRL